MSAIDYAFLGVCMLLLVGMLAGSKVVRAIFWETLRHPFQPSRIEMHQGKVVVSHSQSRSTAEAQSSSPAGVG